MKTNIAASTALLLIGLAPLATANMEVRFVESAPKDWFSLTNDSNCFMKEFTMEVDLSNTLGKLIFDTTAAGAGVEVFQPFEQREGDIRLSATAKVPDGENMLSLLINNLGPGQSVSFTIDVDDTLPNSKLGNIRVSDSEIAGGTVRLKIGAETDIVGTFDTNARISLPSPGC